MWRFAWWRRQDKPRWPTSFKETAARVCQFAERVARRHYHEYVGVEHVLLALLDAAPNPATELLRHCGLMPEQVRQAIEAVIEAGPGPVPRGRLPRTPNLERALIVAQAEKLQASSQASVVAAVMASPGRPAPAPLARARRAARARRGKPGARRRAARR